MALLDPRPVADAPRSWWRSPRWIGAALAAGVPLGMIALLLVFMPRAFAGAPYFLTFRGEMPSKLPRKIESPAPAPPLFRYAPPAAPCPSWGSCSRNKTAQ